MSIEARKFKNGFCMTYVKACRLWIKKLAAINHKMYLKIEHIVTLFNVISWFLPAADSSKQTTDPTKYNTPEYFQYNSYSYYDIDASMGKFRLAQPNKFDPLVPKK